MRRDIEADLVVALARAAVGDGVGALALGDLDEELGDQRPGQGGGQRVGALVERVGLQVRPDEVGDEPLAGIDDVGARRAGRHRPGLDARSRSEPPPTSTVRVTTSTPYCSLSQATATDVSSPPE